MTPIKHGDDYAVETGYFQHPILLLDYAYRLCLKNNALINICQKVPLKTILLPKDPPEQLIHVSEVVLQIEEFLQFRWE